MAAISGLDLLMVTATTAGLLLVVVGIPWWLARRDRSLFCAALLATLAGLAASVALQYLINSPRPATASALLPQPPLPSYPSGHAVLVAAQLGVLAAYRWRVALALLPLGLLVSGSRVYLGHHVPIDVVGGLILGAALATGLVSRSRSGRSDPWRLRWLLWPQVGLVLVISLAAYTGTLASVHQPWLRIPGIDKVLHLVLFGALAFGTHFALRGRTLALRTQRIPLAVLLPLAAACLDEIVQAATPHRTADLGDLVADVAGLWLFTRVAQCLSARRQPAPLSAAD